ncbi:MAG: hypothetical protein AAF752_13085, partial [Bacteroidota bacterium]
MKRLSSLGLMLGLLTLLVAGCDSADDGVPQEGSVRIFGQVVNAETQEPVSEALIRLEPIGRVFTADTEGRYDFSIDVDSTTTIEVIASKEGFDSDRTTITAVAEREIEVPAFRLTRIAVDGPVSGRATSILLSQQTATTIGIRESGSAETASLTFVMADSLGRPVTLENKAVMRFSLATTPGGGEYIFPESTETNNAGEAIVNLTSGLRAGVIQIVAEADVDGETIRSKPVSMTIHGGLPDQTHFTIAPSTFNFPGNIVYGLTAEISVIVGDEYSNPVRPGTAVYFNTSHGVIEGAVETGAAGGGSVRLISANPLPGSGEVAVVRASTSDKNENEVVGYTAVVMSGPTTIQVTPGFAALGQTYQVRLADPFGNPLTEGTTLSVTAEGTKVKAVGNSDVTLGETIIRG